MVGQGGRLQAGTLILALLLAALHTKSAITDKVSRPGGAGHALQFQDHVLVKTDFRDFPTTALTFEAWISTSDVCHAGTVMSYAKDSQATDDAKRIADFNHFVIFDTRALLACHDFQYIDLEPDPVNISCHAAYTQNGGDRRKLPSLVDRDGQWHHLAVTWDALADGLTQIYVDGSLMASARTHKTAPLEPYGAFMLGGEQDCYGGCVDPAQGFHGLMDEVRIWNTALPQEDIVRRMRWSTGLEGSPNLVAWWHFDEPNASPGIFSHTTVARDASGRGNDLLLETPPRMRDAVIPLPGGRDTIRTGTLDFRNGLAINKRISGFPTKSFSVEMWARGAAVQELDNLQQRSSQLFSYAAVKGMADAYGSFGFLDDAVRIERILASTVTRRRKWGGADWLVGTSGAVALHVNSNEQTDDPAREALIMFDAQWVDDKWHHLAVSWDYETGVAALYLDGTPRVPFYKSDFGAVEERSPVAGGVDPSLAARTPREGSGSLVLGQDQDCLGGCFSPADAFNGQMAVVRLWDRPLGPSEVVSGMSLSQPPSERRSGLVALWSFGPEGKGISTEGTPQALDTAGGTQQNHLQLRGNAPAYVYSTAPLAASNGAKLPEPTPGAGGYSLALSDRQVLLLPNFRDFPATSLTLEFWMTSTDRCQPGVPFSYAVGDYNAGDNAFLLFNYNSWGVSVMEDEGRMADHQSGVAVTDGKWHHVAVTWDSNTGIVRLYDNGRLGWQAVRGKGRTIPSGGTLVIGREQDCKGGCFDSAEGAAGNISPVTNMEYGSQDFTGVMEEMRLWNRVRSPEEIRAGMEADDGRGPGGFDHPGVDPSAPGLVAYWRFDEGAGYRVADVTGRGHDLLMLQQPRWVVTRWLSSCGNAVVEGMEECDDGDLTDGDGCSSTCRVEPGWICSGSPSHCTRSTGPTPQPQPQPQPKPQPTPAPAPGPTPSAGPTPTPAPTPAPVPSGGDGGVSPAHTDAAGGGGGGGGGAPRHQHRSHAGLVVALVVGCTLLLVVVGGVAAARTGYAQVPRTLQSLHTGLARRLPLPAGLRARLGPEYNPLVVNPEELDMSPEFICASPPRSTPGHPGGYHPLSGSSPGLSSPGMPWMSAPPTPLPGGRNYGGVAGGGGNGLAGGAV